MRSSERPGPPMWSPSVSRKERARYEMEGRVVSFDSVADSGVSGVCLS